MLCSLTTIDLLGVRSMRQIEWELHRSPPRQIALPSGSEESCAHPLLQPRTGFGASLSFTQRSAEPRLSSSPLICDPASPVGTPSTFGIMSVELEEADLPLTEAEEAPLAPEKKGASKKAKAGGSSLSPSKRRKNNKKKNQPGKYSQLVVETIRKLGERNGSSLAKIYNEAKKVAWFDQQNGRTYLKYSIKALVQNDTLLQVKGTGANGSFKLNKKKLEGGGEGGAGSASHAKTFKKAAVAAASTSRKAEKKPVVKSKKPEKKSHKKSAGGGSAKKDKVKAKKAAKKTVVSPSAKKVKKSAKPKALKSRKA
ncbi:UNVERIFIED_CONTAM: hypothetical protein K2H54_050677 [Gekko kuhli]